MSVSQITWQDVQQAPDDGKRREAIGGELYERQGVREYWIVDPEEDAVEVWRFGETGEAARHERFTERLPVRPGGDTVGEVDLEAVFRRA